MPDYALLNQCLYEGKAKEVEQLVRDALAEGRPAQEILAEGLIAGMSVVGEDFKHNLVYVPEVLIAARAMKAGMAVLKPLLSVAGAVDVSAGRLLMGTVRGDLHDIGKNLVGMMAEGAGFVVKDIGVDQGVEKFLAAADEFKPDIIGLSALLTTTMTYMKTVVDRFKAEGRGHLKIAIGGAPVSQMFADEIGADGYAGDASSAVDLFLHLVGKGPAPVAARKAAPAPVAAPPAETPAGPVHYRVLYWRDLPAAVRAWNDATEIRLDLPGGFAERIDAAALRLGLAAGDDYTAQFRWGDEQSRAGTPAAVAEQIARELEPARP